MDSVWSGQRCPRARRAFVHTSRLMIGLERGATVGLIILHYDRGESVSAEMGRNKTNTLGHTTGLLMSVELDHVFICCDIGAPEAALLVKGGLREGSSNTHPGQGTANRRFSFANAYLELLWVSDPAEAQTEAVLPTGLWEHWSRRSSGPCPFGLVFRPGADSVAEAPFPTWSYGPAYLPSGFSIEVGRDTALSEPQLFYLPFARRRDPSGREPTAHAAGIDRITRVSVSTLSQDEPSETLLLALAPGLFTIRRGPAYLLELGFDGKRGASLDLRPDLPLLFTPR